MFSVMSDEHIGRRGSMWEDERTLRNKQVAESHTIQNNKSSILVGGEGRNYAGRKKIRSSGGEGKPKREHVWGGGSTKE